MKDVFSFDEIEMLFDPSIDKPLHFQFKETLRKSLHEILPDQFFDLKWQEDRSKESIRKKFLSLFPLVKKIATGSSLSFFCLSRYRANSFKFFFDLISQWLIPGRRLDVVLVYAVDFRLPKLTSDLLTFCEIIVRIDQEADFEIIDRSFPIIESEARLGVDSDYYARKILEIKGVSSDQKIAMIQNRIASLSLRMPQMFSNDVFSEMQHFLVLCDEGFKQGRSASHISRLVSILYVFRRRLEAQVKEFPTRRHIYLKMFKTIVKFPSEKKEVLALMVGLNILREKEVFDQRHIVNAIQKYIPNAEVIDLSFFSNRKGSKNILTTYVELKKNDGKDFTKEELLKLRFHLPNDLQTHIGQLMQPVFLPRNEEEIMRTILSLGHQLKYLRDIPQVSISFDEQTDRNLFFTVIFVRILKGDEKQVQDKMKAADSFLKYLHDRTRVIGSLRRKYPKEANVFRVKFPKDSFLRGDHSIDLYKARQAVVSELSRVLGDFRDFNGGMISKQSEMLSEVKMLLAEEEVKYSDILLENFFYSLAPVIMRTVLEPHAFKTLFKLLMQQQEPGQRVQYDPGFSFVVMADRHRNRLDELSKVIHKNFSSGTDLVQGYLKTPELVFMGYIFRSADLYKQSQFHALVDELFLNPETQEMKAVTAKG